LISNYYDEYKDAVERLIRSEKFRESMKAFELFIKSYNELVRKITETYKVAIVHSPFVCCKPTPGKRKPSSLHLARNNC